MPQNNINHNNNSTGITKQQFYLTVASSFQIFVHSLWISPQFKLNILLKILFSSLFLSRLRIFDGAVFDFFLISFSPNCRRSDFRVSESSIGVVPSKNGRESQKTEGGRYTSALLWNRRGRGGRVFYLCTAQISRPIQ